MFFDLPVEERTAEVPIAESKAHYAMAVNRGRRMIETPHPDEGRPWQRIEVDRHYRTADDGSPEEPYAYYDAVSDILQARGPGRLGSRPGSADGPPRSAAREGRRL